MRRALSTAAWVWVVVNGVGLYLGTPGVLAALGIGCVLIGAPMLLRQHAAALVGASLAISIVLAELALTALDLPPTMPAQLRPRGAEVPPGAARAAYWHGHLHVLSPEGFRMAGAPELELGRRRIVALGDSITYGWGVGAEEAWPARLEAITPGTRVYNLGVAGRQSEDILAIARRWVPELRPEVVVYGICLNDLLPSGRAQTTIEVPWWWVQTRIGHLVAGAYRAIAAPDFYGDLEERGDWGRFALDLRDLRELADQEHARLVVMVLDAHPDHPRARALARRVEWLARRAGVLHVETEGLRRYHGDLSVSRWEGHPSAAAQALYATAIAEALGPANPRCSFESAAPQAAH